MEPIRKATGLDLILLTLLALIWASSFQAIKVIVVETGPLWLAALRVVTAFAALLPWTLYRGVVLPKGARQWRLLLVIVVLNIVIPFCLVSFAELTISSGEAALILGIIPLFSLTISHFATRDDTLNGSKFLAVLIGFGGVAMVIGSQAINAIGDHVFAQAAVLVAGFCLASSGVLVRRVEGIPPTRLTTLTTGIGALILLPAAFLVDGALPPVSTPNIWAMIYLGVLPTGLASILRFHLIRQIGASMFSHVGNLIPVFAVALGAILLSEPITPVMILALALIIAGVVLARAGSRGTPA